MKNYYFLALLALIPPVINFSFDKDKSATAALPPSFKQQPFILQEDAKQKILAHNLWDKERGKIINTATKKNLEKQTTDWQLKAVKQADFAILQIAKEIKTYYEGESFPDGAILKKILLDGIIIQRETETKHVYLFGKKS